MPVAGKKPVMGILNFLLQNFLSMLMVAYSICICALNNWLIA